MYFRRRTYKAARHVPASAEWCLSDWKMRSFVVLLLLLVCQLATPIPIFDRDGAGFQGGHRSAGIGETIRDWFRIVKNRIMDKWQEWFGGDSPIPRFSPQDILNIDRTLESRVHGYPGFILDLSKLSFDTNEDWGVRFGNWYIIRKVAGENSDGDSDEEWDVRHLVPNLHLPPILKFNWTPNKHGSRIPETARPTTTTPRIEFATSPRETSRTVAQTESSISVSTGSTATTVQPTVASTEPISPVTQLTVTFTAPTATSTDRILSSNESAVTEPIAVSTESTVPFTGPTTTSTGSVATSNEQTVISIGATLPSAETTAIFTESIVTSAEPAAIASESTVTSIEEIAIITESPTTSTELTLPVLNKRIEDNETIDRGTRRPNNQPASVEVVMF